MNDVLNHDTRNPAGHPKVGSFGFVNGIDQRILINTGHCADDIGVEHPTRHGGRDEHIAS